MQVNIKPRSDPRSDPTSPKKLGGPKWVIHVESHRAEPPVDVRNAPFASTPALRGKRRQGPIAAHNVRTATRISKLTPARPVESSVPARRARSNRKQKEICYTSPMKTFSDKARDIVRKIPKGKTMSYKAVAAKAGNSKAARAVGAIMRTNYDPSIPCHRVIASDGSMRGDVRPRRRPAQQRS
ncbi:MULTISPECIES: MGMT family protein [Bradyrhizobium]|jgi:methylated-DNA-[protein]-cysteine S-methyltransferase|nr:MGMT family protein [Bradyrhizobium elkanii]QOZ18524.1 methylated-DNA--[protein]-cysteine S-methyltransferase [Bradyrhizobium sp. CCBAU 21365]RYM20072.1 MGMT family protein [Bradyrhizobium elkanii]